MTTGLRAFAFVTVATLMSPQTPAGSASSGQASSQPATSAPTAPDISGVWLARFVPRLAPAPPMLPAAEAILKSRKPEEDPMGRCLPPGVPRLGSTSFPIEIVQTRGRVTILYEYDHYVRRIFTDGRKHPADLDPTWLGHSIGHWEGQTLVVDTVGLHDVSWLDEPGHPASPALRVIERYTKSGDGKTLLHEITIDDPKMYKEPWKSQKTYTARPDMPIMEFICETR